MTNGRRPLRFEHRLTAPNATLDQLVAAVHLATEHDLAAIVVAPWLVRAAKRQLGRSRVGLGTVVGFPHGGQLLAVKAFEASKALEHGASQIDFVVNGGALLSGEDELVLNDLLAGVDMAHSALATAGVIVESERLPDAIVRRACRLAERAGADYVVTGVGAATPRRTIDRVAVLRDSVGPRVAVKAAGRLRTGGEMRAAAAAGASRVATTLTASILRDAAAGGHRQPAQPAPIAG